MPRFEGNLNITGGDIENLGGIPSLIDELASKVALDPDTQTVRREQIPIYTKAEILALFALLDTRYVLRDDVEPDPEPEPDIPATNSTPLAFVAAQKENITQTGASIALTSTGNFGRAVWNLKLPAGAAGILIFTFGTHDGASTILSRSLDLPSGGGNGSVDFGIFPSSGKVRTVYLGNTDYGTSVDVVANMLGRITTDGTNLTWATSTDNGATFTTLRTVAQGSNPLYFKQWFDSIGGELQQISYGGGFIAQG